jgi:outer membrane protein OmpA-like peptidoglycan-associated protein
VPFVPDALRRRFRAPILAGMGRASVACAIFALTACHVSGAVNLQANAPTDDAKARPAPPEETSPPAPVAAKAPESAGAAAPVLVLDIDFGFGSAKLTDSDRKTLSKPETLDVLCKAVAKYKSLTVEGHADSRGADAYNLRLTQQRAESVRDALLANSHCHVDGSQLVAVGVGKKGPPRCPEPPECLGKDKGPANCEACWNENRMTIISITEDRTAAAAPPPPAPAPTPAPRPAASSAALDPSCSRVLVLGEERGSRMCE